jgi:hypothetical protein
MRMLLRFPWSDSGKLEVNFRLLDLVFAYSLQIVRGEQRVLGMLQVKDTVNRVAGAARLQLLQGHTHNSTLNKCFNRESRSSLERDP